MSFFCICGRGSQPLHGSWWEKPPDSQQENGVSHQALVDRGEVCGLVVSSDSAEEGPISRLAFCAGCATRKGFVCLGKSAHIKCLINLRSNLASHTWVVLLLSAIRVLLTKIKLFNTVIRQYLATSLSCYKFSPFLLLILNLALCRLRANAERCTLTAEQLGLFWKVLESQTCCCWSQDLVEGTQISHAAVVWAYCCSWDQRSVRTLSVRKPRDLVEILMVTKGLLVVK